MLSLRTKLWAGFGGLLLILVVVSAMSVAVLTRYSHALERVFHENYDSAVYCDAMKDALDQLNTRAQRLIWEKEAVRDADTRAQRERFEVNLRNQLGNCTLPGEAEASAQLASLWNEYKSHYDAFTAAQEADRPQLYRADLLPRYQYMKQVAQRLAERNMSNMVAVDGQAKRTLVGVRNAMLLLVIAGTVVAAALVLSVGATILRPLTALTRSARQIETGNLDLALPVRSSDEVGRLSEAFNAMASRLREFRKLDHERLARTQQTTQLAIDSLPDAVFVIGPDGAIEISNKTAREHFGIRPGTTVTGLGVGWLTPLYEQVKDRHQPVEPRGYESAIQLFEGGHERFLLPRAVPMLGDGKSIGVTVILVDVTRLRHADEAKGSVLSTASHELRTPLTSIRMALGMLVGDKFGPLGEKQRMLLTAAREDSDRLYRIIDNLLNISRIEAGRAQFHFRATPPAEIVAQAVEPLRPGFGEKNVRLSLSLPDDLPEVMADPASVGYALTNLLTNAMKFTPAGGEVRVASARDGEFVAFTVADTGPGIAPAYRQRIFEKFFRIPHPTGPTGAGLGLAIAKEIVEAHGGRIEFRPADAPTGSTFRFTLPRWQRPAENERNDSPFPQEVRSP